MASSGFRWFRWEEIYSWQRMNKKKMVSSMKRALLIQMVICKLWKSVCKLFLFHIFISLSLSLIFEDILTTFLSVTFHNDCLYLWKLCFAPNVLSTEKKWNCYVSVFFVDFKKDKEKRIRLLSWNYVDG